MRKKLELHSLYDDLRVFAYRQVTSGKCGTQLFMSDTDVFTPHWLLLPEEVALTVTFSSNASTSTGDSTHDYPSSLSSASVNSSKSNKLSSLNSVLTDE